MRFFVPVKRDIRTIPPLLSVIKGLGRAGHDVCLFCHNYDPSAFDGTEGRWLRVEAVSDRPYPKKPLPRLVSTAHLYWTLRRHLARNSSAYDYVWLGTWDFRYFRWIAKSVGLSARFVRQLHEYEPERFRRSSSTEVVVVPEENRAWLTYFAAGLSRKPLVLPNTPIDHPRRWTGVPEPSIARQKDAGKIVIVYQGNIDMRKRCLEEMLGALAILPAQFVLALMPLPDADEVEVRRVKQQLAKLKLSDRAIWIESRNAPRHLDILAQAHIGIGLYRPTSLNQVYCAPNRLYEFTGFGIPVVLPDFPGLRQLASRYPGIVTCDPESVTSIAAAIRPLADATFYEKVANSANQFFDEQGCYMEHLELVLEVVSKSGRAAVIGKSADASPNDIDAAASSQYPTA